MMKRILPTILFVFSVVGLAHGQGNAAPKPTPPPDPQVAPVPATISFVKTFMYHPQPLPPKMTEAERKYHEVMDSIAKVNVLEIIKTGEVLQVFQHMTNGATLEIWKSGGFEFLDDGNRPANIQIAGPGMGGARGDTTLAVRPEADFSELSWVNKKVFVDEELLSGIKCYAYKDPAAKQAAYIDETSRLPLRFDSSKLSIVYSYKTPPSQTLVLPPAFAKRMTESVNAWHGGPG